MSQQELLTHVVVSLDRAGIEYMITGSIVSSLQGEPPPSPTISTVVVAIQNDQIPHVLEAFPSPRFHVDEQSIKEAILTSGMFNVIDSFEGDKIDFWPSR